MGPGCATGALARYANSPAYNNLETDFPLYLQYYTYILILFKIAGKTQRAQVWNMIIQVTAHMSKTCASTQAYVDISNECMLLNV
jgi:hypothetical protein